jgi:SOS-response transcriptional repressor LexA
MTRQQTEVFEYIKRYINISGYSPTYKEITDQCKLSSRSHAWKVVDALIKSDLIIKKNKKICLINE